MKFSIANTRDFFANYFVTTLQKTQFSPSETRNIKNMYGYTKFINTTASVLLAVYSIFLFLKKISFWKIKAII